MNKENKNSCENQDIPPSIIFPLSTPQQGIWFAHHVTPDAAGKVLKVAGFASLQGKIQPELMEAAARQAIHEAETLRISAFYDEGKLYQSVESFPDWHFSLIDLTEEDDPDRAARRWLKSRADFPLPLEQKQPLFDIALLKSGKSRFYLYCSTHHIAADGYGFMLFNTRLAEIYSSLVAGEPASPGDILGVAAQVEAEQAYRNSSSFLRDKEYWLAQMSQNYHAVSMASVPVSACTDVLSEQLRIQPETYNRLQTIARKHDSQLSTLLIALTSVYLHLMTGETSLLTGFIHSGRMSRALRRTTGLLANVLPLGIHVSPDMPLEALLEQVRLQVNATSRRSRFPAEDLRQMCGQNSTDDRWFSTIINYIPSGYRLNYGDVSSAITYTAIGPVDDFSFNIYDWGPELGFNLIFNANSALYQQEELQRHIRRFHHFLTRISCSENPFPCQTNILSAEEHAQIMTRFQGISLDYPRTQCIHHLFEQQAMCRSDATAVVSHDCSLTYGELNARANQLAHGLIEKGVQPGRCVAIAVERSCDMVVAMLATLKAGAAYVPLDPVFPAQRLQYMVADSQPAVLISDSSMVLEDTIGSHLTGLDIIDLKQDRQWFSQLPETNPGVPALNAEQLAYVIYTSGSTGKPKGVMVPHRSVMNFLLSQQQQNDVTQDTRLLAVTTISFDIHVLEIYLPLICGGELHLAGKNLSRDGDALGQYLIAHNITLFQATPATWKLLLASSWHGSRKLTGLIGGESFSKGLADTILSRVGRLRNMYGPTETTVWSATWDIRETDPCVLIGHPVANTRIYLLDAQRKLVPVGAVGEIYIAGDGVTHGYLNRQDLTEAAFVDDPFSTQSGALMYRTGDLARQHANGAIECLGRCDFQVKIRGYRIEPGEIESLLLACEGIDDAVVSAADIRGGEPVLVAYLITRTGIGTNDLKTQLRARLPDYMVPVAYVAMEAFPLTPNGKVDRKALPAPDISALSRNGYEAPQEGTEARLAEIWQHLFDIEQIGRHDHFFELGGHSLLAMQLIARIRDEFSQEPALATIFAQPVLCDLARALAVAPAKRPAPDIVPYQSDVPPPLSMAQQRLWLLSRFHPEATAAYNMVGSMLLDGPLDIPALRRALDHIVKRHHVLRSYIEVRDGEPVLQTGPQTQGMKLSVIDGDCDVHAGFPPAFDLSAGPLIQAQLIRLDEQTHRLRLAMHHMISDGWSVGILIREVSQLYTAFVQAQPDPLPALPVQYGDYAAWQREYLQGEMLQEQQQFWTEQLQGIPDCLTLPADRPRPQNQQFAGANVTRLLDESLTSALHQLSYQNRCTLFMTLMSGWAALMGRLAGQDDVVIGTPVAGRTHTALESLIGMFVNTQAIRVGLSDTMTTAGLLAQVKATVLTAQEYQDLPFEQVVEAVSPTRSLSHSPVFQVMLGLQNLPETDINVPGLVCSDVETEVMTAQFDLNLQLHETGNTLIATLNYSTALFDEATVQRYLDYWQQLLTAMTATPEVPLSQLPILDDAEYRQVTDEFNQTQTTFPNEQLPENICVHQLFEQTVIRQPEATAVVCEQQTLTFRELNQQANQLARWLVTQGVCPDSRVAVSLERSCDLVVALMATLKAGGAYVPLDPGYPQERLAYMLADSQPVVILTTAELQTRLGEIPEQTVVADMAAIRPWTTEATDNLNLDGLNHRHLAYMIYTSGSTGNPKGVMNEHRGVVNRLNWMKDDYGFSPDDVVLQKTPFSFDVSVWEFFCSLWAGSTLVMAKPEGHKDPLYLKALIEQQQVSILHFVPPMLQTFLEVISTDDCQSLRLVFCSGEALPAAVVRKAAQRMPLAELHNLYGPTEAAVDVTAWACPKDLEGDRMSIGAPVANTRMYVLDTQGQPVPVGVSGELYIGGVQVARGYFNREALTAEKFLADPFSHEPNARMYRTGDVGRWLADGTIEYQGRNDDQVKIRGFRVELGEIGSALQDCEGVHEAVVIASGQGADKRLVGYYTQSNPAQPVALEAIKASLAVRLPDYMVPAAYVMLEKLPLTPNGKVNRRALPEPDDTALIHHSYEAPRGEAEQCLAAIWQSLLHVEQVGRHDNFFELGGHSLMAVLLIERLRQQGWHLAIRELFQQTSLAALASVLTTGQSSQAVAVPPNLIPADCREITPEMLPLVTLTPAEIETISATVEGGGANIQDIYPLAPLQEGILFHHLMQQQGDPYVTRFIQAFDQEADVDAFVAALQHVVSRHDILRTAVVWDGLETPVQVVWRQAPVRLSRLDIAQSDDVLSALQAHFDPAQTRMDVQRAPMIEAYKVADPQQDRWLLCFLLHHLCNDHTTMELLAEEVMLHLSGRADELPVPLPFRNFVAQTTSAVNRDSHQAYFQALLADRAEPCVAFGVAERDADQPIQTTLLNLDDQLAQRLRELARQRRMSVAAIVHLAWALVVRVATGQEDVVFGTVLFGRMAGGEGADRALGMFLNTLPLRLSPGIFTADEALHQAQQRLAELLDHEHASLAQAQQCSSVSRKATLFNSIVNYRYQGGNQQQPDDTGTDALRHTVVYVEENTNYPLTLTINDIVGGGFSAEVQADARIGSARVADMFSHALNQLTGALEHTTETPLQQLAILPDSERHQVISGFNQTQTPFPDNQCIHQLFEQTVAAQPHATAVVSEQQSLTYHQLNQQANQLARWLVSQGVCPDSRVAVSLERSCDLVVALMATLKAGGAYVPLDPGYPQERLACMLADSQPVVVLTTAELQSRLGEMPDNTTVVDMTADRPWAALETHNLNRDDLNHRHLAYIIYTSGSTGHPKGVMNEHRGVVNRLSWMKDDYGFGPTDVVLQKTPFSFDVSVWEFFCSLWAGATLVMAKPEGHKDPLYLKTLIEQRQVTILHFVPPMLQTFLEGIEAGDCDSLRLVFCSGEALPAAAVRKTTQRLPNVALHNLYGPTEAAVDVTAWACPHNLEGDRMSIGAPVANTRMYVLDGQGQPVPVGVPGELYIGGVQVARGYLNRPELTAEKFVADPFAKEACFEGTGATMYRTGDVGCWLPDGTIDYQGRNDDQVKIRGFRVELGEISSALQDCSGVQEAVVIARGDGADKQLVGYYTHAHGTGAPVALASVKADLSARLPEYMVPSAYVVLESLPLTPNGKVNRKALPEPDESALVRHAYEAPQGETEQTLAAIWQQLLGVAQVGRHDNFFELGGHSLLAIRFISEAQKQGFRLDLATLFASPVLSSLAEIITLSSATRSEADPVIPFRTTGSQAPLFIVPEFSGELLYGPALTAAIDADIPVYGLSAPDRMQPSLKTYQGMAARYVQMIRRTQPQGPYRLLGWSSGGVVAYEIAAQLLGLDQTVEFIGMLDSWKPGLIEKPVMSEQAKMRDLSRGMVTFLMQQHGMSYVQAMDGGEMQALAKQTSDEQAHQPVVLPESGNWQDDYRAGKAAGCLPPHWSETYFHNMLIHQRDFLDAEYEALPLPVEIDLIAAQDNPSALGELYLGWDQVLESSQIHVESVPGEHYELVTAPFLPRVGQAVSAALRATVARRRTQASQPDLRHGSAFDPVVTLQAGEEGQPLCICIPGAGDNVLTFVDLVQAMPKAQTMLALQPRGLWGNGVPHSSVEAAAAFYLQALAPKLAQREIHVLGHSFGGWVAMALVNQMEAQGIAVASLTIADSRAPVAPQQVEYTNLETMMWLIRLFEMRGKSLGLTEAILAPLTPAARLARLHQGLTESGLMPKRTALKEVAAIYRSFSANVRTRYIPEALPQAPVSLLLASDVPETRLAEWQSFAPSVQVCRSQGNHVMLLKSPDVSVLADLIQGRTAV
ncbi:non-ribosomal peptide synthetase [Vibrio quintilis]|uniref:Tyrocidine synthase 3 n=1 Tax=Vibrio quintilis TaxID=1117707 RepID=A0A1M7YX30_9VIBR|nr:non-ribosomal peptide synthetase [Vibrio quintilis]SHO57056.1 Tyrocidine synthase 3 [Vibrio quintilis]